MFNATFNKQQDSKMDTCILSNTQGTKAVIYPALGASLQQLYFDGETIINNLITKDASISFLNSSCSAILFPFANRINDGCYQYNNQTYQLECNETARGHALHGLVYKKRFEVLSMSALEDVATAVLEYQYDGSGQGFPFPFTIQLTYTLTVDSLTLAIDVHNIGTSSFPFSLGWHPYFYSTNLEASHLMMDSATCVLANERMIPTGQKAYSFPNPLLIKDKNFDDAYVLSNPAIAYQTPSYQISITTTQDSTTPYVQLYIPSHRQSIAIEPMTAAADCFNNDMGGQELEPNDSYHLAWSITHVK